MSERMIARMLAPLARGLGNMLARGTVVLANAASKMQTLQVKLLSGEVKDGIEHFEAYGLTAHPKSGAEHITLFMGGDRSHGVTIMVADRRYRLAGLAEGEVALYDDLGQKVHLTRTGIVVHSTLITLDAPTVHVTGNLNVDGNITGQMDISDHDNKSMSGMRSIYNSHTHSDPQGGSVGTPGSSM